MTGHKTVAAQLPGGDFNRATNECQRVERVLDAPHGPPLVTHQPLHGASFGGVCSIYPQCCPTFACCLAGLGWLPVISSLAFVVLSQVLAGHWAGGSLNDGLVITAFRLMVQF